MIKYKAKIQKDDEGYFVEFLDLPGCVTSGDSKEQAIKNAVEALDLYLEEANDPRWPLPKARNHKNSEWVIASDEVSIPLMIREARKKKKLTQNQAAELLGMKLQTYQKLEYIRKSNPTAFTLLKIAKAFDTKFELSA